MFNNIFALLLVFTANASASPKLAINFSELVKCEGQFGYEKVFLMAGRSVSEKLVEDPIATEFMSTLVWKGKPLKVVSQAYSIELFENYINYASLKGKADRLAVVLVEDNAEPHNGPFDYDLLLVVTQGLWKGFILSQHTASYDESKKIISSDRFNCWK